MPPAISSSKKINRVVVRNFCKATYNGVNYNKLMTPNIPTSNVELDVFEATKSAAVARVAQHMMLVEPSTSNIAVSENFVVDNDSTSLTIIPPLAVFGSFCRRQPMAK